MPQKSVAGDAARFGFHNQRAEALLRQSLYELLSGYPERGSINPLNGIKIGGLPSPDSAIGHRWAVASIVVLPPCQAPRCFESEFIVDLFTGRSRVEFDGKHTLT